MYMGLLVEPKGYISATASKPTLSLSSIPRIFCETFKTFLGCLPPPCRPEGEEEEEEREEFVYPGVPSSKECNVHPKRPDSSRLNELSIVSEGTVIPSDWTWGGGGGGEGGGVG